MAPHTHRTLPSTNGMILAGQKEKKESMVLASNCKLMIQVNCWFSEIFRRGVLHYTPLNKFMVFYANRGWTMKHIPSLKGALSSFWPNPCLTPLLCRYLMTYDTSSKIDCDTDSTVKNNFWYPHRSLLPRSLSSRRTFPELFSSYLGQSGIIWHLRIPLGHLQQQ